MRWLPTTGAIRSLILATLVIAGSSLVATSREGPGAGGRGSVSDGIASATPAPAASPVASPGASPVAEIENDTFDANDRLTVEMRDIAFEPKAVTIPADTDVTIVLPNKGALLHTFVIDELDVHSGDVPPGETVEVAINAPAGTYEYYCDVPGHKAAGMVGTLTIE